MRRSAVVLAILVAFGLISGPLLARANAVQLLNGQTQTTTGTCSLNYTLTGSFSRLGGTTTFSLGATGNCVGVPSGPATANIAFNSLGSWSCLAGTALEPGPSRRPATVPNSSPLPSSTPAASTPYRSTA